MQIELLIRKAVAELKSKWELPSTGFIGGGSIANLVWEYVSGVKARVNDIDIFVKVEEKEETTSFEWEKKAIQYSERYSHLIQTVFVKEKYKIFNVTREGMLNFIYVSQEADPLKILRSFDINATCVGYSIDEDKCYYLECFSEFLSNKELKIINLMTPSHTAIRLAKKEKDLSVKANDFEFNIIQICLYNKWLPDFDRFRFQNKYAKLFEEYNYRLSQFFSIQRCSEIEDFLEKKTGNQIDIWELKNNQSDFASAFFLKASTKFVLTSDDVLFYLRNIHGNEIKDAIWQKIAPFYKTKEYLDTENKEDIERLISIASAYPGVIKNLVGWPLTEQLKIIDKVFSSIGTEYGKEAAIKVLESNKITPDTTIDDFEAMILVLSVRKKLHKPDFGADLPF